MSLFNFLTYEKDIFVKIGKTFLLSFILVMFLAIYWLGETVGYINGKVDAQNEYIASQDGVEKVVATPSPTLSPTLTPVTSKELPPSTWGGPELWQAVNAKRVEYGVNSLNQSDELCTIASIRLNELLDLGTLDGHKGFSTMQETRPDLKWIFEKYSAVAEFLAIGGETPQETVSLWDNTLGHKKLLTGGEYVWGCVYAQNTFAVAIVSY